MIQVQFLIEKDSEPNEVFAFSPNEKYSHVDNKTLVCYSHIGQHSACHIDYAKECKEANYNEYSDLLSELIGQGYKDIQVLNKQEIEAHREPTKVEIKFGEGTTHYRDFTIAEILDKKGNIKSRFKAKDDGLTYSTR